MLKVGLTGGIAAGKSSVGEMFVTLGARLVQADLISHALMAPGEAVYDKVVRHFGREILNQDGSVNRSKLAEIVFGSPSESGGKRVEELNRIVHPAVIRKQEEWMQEMGRQDPHVVAIVEAALILESGARERFDRLIVVTCNEEQRIARFAARQKTSLDAAGQEVRRRMAAQFPDEEKIKAADYVIDNSGTLDQTRAQVGKVWQQLRAAAE
jgi:dephospho-CoA kinase